LDLNYLHKRHRASLFMAENASDETVRQIHREFGQRYAARIADAMLRQREVSAA
jgi:hypothetical protein